MQKYILCLFVIACVVAVSYAFPEQHAAAAGVSELEDSFSGVDHHHDEAAHAEGDDTQHLSRQKRQFFGGYGGYGGYGGFGRRRFYGGYGGYGFRRPFYGGYGFYG